MSQEISIHPQSSGNERALLAQAVFVRQSRSEAEDSLEELRRLADTAGMVVVGVITQRRERPDAASMVGKGKVTELRLSAEAAHADVLVFDNELSSVQAGNIGRAVGVKVIDRNELIMRIFSRRAQTAEARIQVELARLQYLAGRIPVLEEQQRFHGGIGLRGPGESPYHMRRKAMLARISVLKRKLEGIQKRRQRARSRHLPPVVCLIGYTNAGKSTLLNACCRTNAYVDDRLFATLDTKSRALVLPNRRQVILTDTVGFIRHLPPGLVASFRSTLEEVSAADMLLLVMDAGHPHVREHLDVVQAALVELSADKLPCQLVFNKCDKESARKALPDLSAEFPDALTISAFSRTDIEIVKTRIAGLIPGGKNN